MRAQIISPAKSPKPVGPYSHAVRVGDLLYTSGQIPLDTEGKLVEGGIQGQTIQVLANIRTILEDQGLSEKDVVKTTVFLVDLGTFSQMNEIYGQFFKTHYPARSTVQVAALPRGAQLEIEVIACYPTN